MALETPFQAASIGGLAVKIINEPPLPLRDVGAVYSQELKALQLSMLRKAPAERPSAGAILRSEWSQQAMSKFLERRTSPSKPEPGEAAGGQPPATERRPGPAPRVSPVRMEAQLRDVEVSRSRLRCQNEANSPAHASAIEDVDSSEGQVTPGVESSEGGVAEENAENFLSVDLGSEDVVRELHQRVVPPAAAAEGIEGLEGGPAGLGAVDIESDESEETAIEYCSMVETMKVHLFETARDGSFDEQEDGDGKSVGEELAEGVPIFLGEEPVIDGRGLPLILASEPSDSTTTKLEAIRAYLEDELGLETFLNVYAHASHIVTCEAENAVERTSMLPHSQLHLWGIVVTLAKHDEHQMTSP